MAILDEAQKNGVVIGLRDVTGQVRERLDVDELLSTYPNTFNLFLLALSEIQDEHKSNNDKMGWFQIAGKAFPQKKFVVTDLLYAQVFMVSL